MEKKEISTTLTEMLILNKAEHISIKPSMFIDIPKYVNLVNQEVYDKVNSITWKKDASDKYNTKRLKTYNTHIIGLWYQNIGKIWLDAKRLVKYSVREQCAYLDLHTFFHEIGHCIWQNFLLPVERDACLVRLFHIGYDCRNAKYLQESFCDEFAYYLLRNNCRNWPEVDKYLKGE